MPWLMKAEPDSRIVKGKDVKFSVDDFEALGTSPWDGVRSHEAKKIMKERMKVGDKVLFYHSNCKTPGVYALAEVAKEGYPDFKHGLGSFLSDVSLRSHPYFDEKTKKDEPTWYMVDVRFVSRLPHPPTLALVKALAASSTLPNEVDYLGEGGLSAIKGMQLVNRGRLSVQTVDQPAYDAIILLGEKGGWDSLVSSKAKPAAAAAGQVKEENNNINESQKNGGPKSKSKRKSTAQEPDHSTSTPTRRSKRNR